MHIVSKISKGSKMDQIYIPKNRVGFDIGNYVTIRILKEGDVEEPTEKLCFYGIKRLEPIKLEIIRDVFEVIDKYIDNYKNIIITGSFLEKGFRFNDVDIIIVAVGNVKSERISENIGNKIGVNGHIIVLSGNELAIGLETDPLYRMMLSKCVAKKRFFYKTRQTINYKLLDLHLLKSKTFIDNFDILRGKEKYDFVRNMISIYLFLNGNDVTVEVVNKEIKKTFGIEIGKIKDNILDKKSFIKKYKLIYDKSFALILKGIEHGSK